jgi:thiol-disulfide isomerase/thioredoxin
MNYRKYLAIFSVQVIFLSCNNTEKNNPGFDSDSEIRLTKIILVNLYGSTVDLTQYKGKTVFINFWATWCKPCLREMPSIQRAQEILQKENIVFLFASNETQEQIENFKNSHEYPFNYVRVENLEELNIMVLPTTFIFNPDGKLVFSEMGFRKWDDKNNINLILNIIKSK